MSTIILAGKRSVQSPHRRDAAGWLGLVASPIFALMAWLSATDMQAMSCASALGIPPVNSMAFMYLLMCFFHLSPWLKLAAALSQQFMKPIPKIQED
ncbi:hypothetical protein PSQ19_14790 [Devosia algicola]|uniref:Uncharacterized protein n=1 Tax=Devosia algicola TaxID=3026418 RepID=A0ABY7YLA3_9HYPH|nr:hypothetical protein [Devosia algicola]WDR01948.1 hypothetical protein PSQ19_14790 [Devosia algicola]